MVACLLNRVFSSKVINLVFVVIIQHGVCETARRRLSLPYVPRVIPEWVVSGVVGTVVVGGSVVGTVVVGGNVVVVLNLKHCRRC